MVDVSVVIPAYNEEESIGKTLDTVFQALEDTERDHEVIVVNNNSTDKTPRIAERHGATVVEQPVQGYGASYKKGLRHASGDYIITGDADATYPFEDIKYFIGLLEEGDYDFITTNRFAGLESGSMPLLNYVGNVGLSALAKLFTGLTATDSQSGMWIFTQEYKERIRFDLMGDGMSFSQEIKIYADYLDVKRREIPIHYHARIGDKKLRPFKDGFDNFVKLLSFRWQLRDHQQR